MDIIHDILSYRATQASTSFLKFLFQLNTGQFNISLAGADHRVQRAWIQGLTGCGVTVAVVDDGNRNPLLSNVMDHTDGHFYNL